MSAYTPNISATVKRVLSMPLLALLVAVIFATGFLTVTSAEAGSAVVRVQAVVLGSVTVNSAANDSLDKIVINGATGTVEYALYDGAGELLSSQFGTPAEQLKSLVAAGSRTQNTQSHANPVLLAVNY